MMNKLILRVRVDRWMIKQTDLISSFVEKRFLTDHALARSIK